MQVSASTLAQKISLSKSNAPLKTVLKEMRIQSGFIFLYNESLIRNTKPVTIEVTNADFTDVLKRVFADQPLVYSIKENTIIIKAKEKSFLEELKERFNTIDVHGRVTDTEGKSLPGASVKIKSTGRTVSTDEKGRFELKGVDEGALLVVSFIGYLSKEVNAGKEMENVVLELSDSKLDEVQVIAYGTTTRRLSTGNVTTVTTEEIENQPVNNPLLALQGRVAGLSITQANGYSGGGVNALIQGQNSISKGNDPFYVIDGVPYIAQLAPNLGGILGNSSLNSGVTGNPLSYINPGDIESISVLKDASATAIYGSRAANGAILITTKKGKPGSIKVDASFQFGFGKTSNKLNLLNTTEYFAVRNQAKKNDNSPILVTDYDINDFWDTTRNTNWQKELIGKTAQFKNVNAAISGGSANTQFLAGITYHKETTVIPGNFSDQKAAFHFSLNNASPNQKFKLQITGNYLFDNNKLPNIDITSHAIRLAPNAPALYNHDGTINWMINSSGASSWGLNNPASVLLNTYNNKTNNLVSNAVLSYEILSGLTFLSSFGYNSMQSDEVQTFPRAAARPEDLPYSSGGSAFGNSSQNSWIIEPQLMFKKRIGNGKIEALLGSTIQENNTNGRLWGAGGYISDELLKNPSAAASLRSINSTISRYRYNAGFGRINYILSDKYIFDISARRDGSSRFGAANQFQNFGALSGAWIISEEEFVKKNMRFVSFAKLRVSYGTTGNDQIGEYGYLDLYRAQPVGVPYQGVTGLIARGLPNPYLQWEETNKLNIGTELGILKDRILFSINYYKNKSSNQLTNQILPSQAGYQTITKNFPATVQNTGFELSFNSVNSKTKYFQWGTGFNFTNPRNKLVKYENLATSQDFYRLTIGQPLNTIKVFHYLGVNHNTGLYQFQGSDGKPTSNPDYGTDMNIIVRLGPKFYGGVSNTISYKKVTLDFLLQFVKQNGLNYTFGGSPGPGRRLLNQPSYVLDVWKNPGDDKSIQKYTTNNAEVTNAYNAAINSDGTYKDASYIRLKNVSLFFSIPNNWINRAGIKKSEIFIQGQNLLTFTRYKGIDPETLSISTLPTLRFLTFGVKASL
jgi:TonB-linked SusC/RagA family outer membrane protein